MSDKFEVGSIVEGKVTKIKPFGALVALDDQTQGLVHISQVANGFVKDINDHLAIGDVVKVKILSIEKESGKISLSIRETLPPPAPRTAGGQEGNRPERRYNNNQDGSKRPERKFNNQEGGYRSSDRHNNRNDYQEAPKPLDPAASLEEKLKEWLKQSNERHAGLNKRNNRR